MTDAVTIVALVCSPGGARTKECAHHVLHGASEAGATVSLIDVPDGVPGDAVLSAVSRAAGVIFAAPTYRGQAAWPLKALLDRVPRAADGTSPLLGKAGLTLLTAASAHHFLGAEPTRTILSDFFAMQLLGPGLYFQADMFGDDGSLQPAAADLARRAGKALHGLAVWAQTSQDLVALRPLV